MGVKDEKTLAAITDLVRSVGGDPETFDGRLVGDLIQTCLRLIPDGHDTGQLKLLNSALKEMRYAYRVFNRYDGARKITRITELCGVEGDHIALHDIFAYRRRGQDDSGREVGDWICDGVRSGILATCERMGVKVPLGVLRVDSPEAPAEKA